MKEINLRTGEKALVSDRDYPLLSAHKWYISSGYVVRIEYLGGGRDNKKTRTVRMHRLIMGAKTGESVDHINGNKLDNRRENLRVCTHRENCSNQKLNKKNTSGFKGVSWHKAARKWRAHLQFKGKQIHLGLYEQKIDAVKAYNKAARRYFGEYARLNGREGSPII